MATGGVGKLAMKAGKAAATTTQNTSKITDAVKQARKNSTAAREKAAEVEVRGRLPDSAIVCRGGSCTAERFSSGSGVTMDSAGKLDGVSVNSAPGKTLEELTEGIPHNKVGVTTVGDVRRAGGDVVASPTRNNPNHTTLSGVTADKAEELMTPTVRNPNKK